MYAGPLRKVSDLRGSTVLNRKEGGNAEHLEDIPRKRTEDAVQRRRNYRSARADQPERAVASLPSTRDAEGEEDIPLSTVLQTMGKQFILLLVIVAPAYALIRFLITTSPYNILFIPLQEVQTALVMWVYSIAGADVQPAAVDGLNIGFVVLPERVGAHIAITAECTGVSECVFSFALISTILGPSLRYRLKWAGIFAGAVFIMNILRLLLIYPTIVLFGMRQWEVWHYWWWKYGQLILIVLAALGWYLLSSPGQSGPISAAREVSR